MPRFTYNLSPAQPDFGWVVAESKRLCFIADFNEFYEALGYTQEMRKATPEPEVFVWMEYRKDNSPKADVCLQANIIAYLFKHSQEFRDKYAGEYSSWVGNCTSDKIRGTEDCTSCRMHPNQGKNLKFKASFS